MLTSLRPLNQGLLPAGLRVPEECLSARGAAVVARKFAVFTFFLMVAGTSLAAPVEFRNFDQTLVLVNESQGYRFANTNHYVQLAPRLIVKLWRASDYGELQDRYPFISDIKELFFNASFIYLLVGVDEATGLQTAIDALERHEGVELVQPDILQLGQKAQSERRETSGRTLDDVFGRPSEWPGGEGGGVRLAVIDDGFDLTHPEFDDLTTVFSYDVSRKALGSRPAGDNDTHGTKIAGILFARADDGNDVSGLVPSAEFIAIRQPDSWTSNSLLSFQLAALADADVVNCSWNTALLLEPIADAITSLATYGRDGLGTPVVFASGNQGREIVSGDSEASLDAAVVVGAGDGDGHTLAFSNSGPSVDLIAYGRPLMTAQAGGGYVGFGGTSLSAALVSGLSARLLSETPNLSLQELTQELEKRLGRPRAPHEQQSEES